MKSDINFEQQFADLLEVVEDYFRTGFRRAVNNNTEGDRDIETIAREIMQCRQCPLHSGRNIPVPGDGSRKPAVMVIGEGPGMQEDKTGKPFVGKAGKYLDRWLAAVKVGPMNTPLSRDTNTFITNVVKCRPPGNRDPLPDEVSSCFGYLQRQVQALSPRAILTVSRFAAQVLIGTTSGIGHLRGKEHNYSGIPLVPTYHPSAVLRDPSLRAPVWEDLKRLKAILDDVNL